jgi:hypothetical protein
MTFNLELLEEKSIDGERAVGRDVILDNLKYDYKVFLFYYSGASSYDELEKKLEDLGKRAGNNLFVNISDLADPKFDLIASKFQIRNTPVIVITGVEGIASLGSSPPRPSTEPPTTSETYSTAFVRIDNKDLLKSTDVAIESATKVFNLFLQGEIKKALVESKFDEKKVKRSKILGKIISALNEIRNFMWQKDVEVEFAGFKLATKATKTDLP